MAIISKCTAGLGNQLFQYAIGRRIADNLGVDLILDNLYYLQTHHYHPFLLTQYNIRYHSPSEDEQFEPMVPYIEKDFGFDSNVLNVTDNVILNGYWQNYEYVRPILDQLRKEFKPLTALTGIAGEAYQHIRKCNTPVALHFRGGDFKGWKKFDVVTKAFYVRAIQRLLEEVGSNITLYIFSDDLDEARVILGDILPSVEIKVPNTGLASNDLYLMSLCKHFIIPSSTFSWWGSLLATNPDKKVYAPEIWFDPEEITYAESKRDLHRPDMTLISN
jgi:hypothetical protein